jgi:methyl-accepting chemotaxis protein
VKESMMKSIRQLETNTKLYASFGLLFLLGGLLAAWLLVQLGDVGELGAKLGKTAAGAGIAEQIHTDIASVRAWAIGLLAAELGFAVMLGLWLAAEVARPVHEAVLVARRVADGDLRMRSAGESGDEAGQLMKAMREMTDKLVSMIVNVRSGTELISSASGEIATGSMDLSARTEQQAASLEETASSMEELTATVKQNAEHAHQANKLAVSASEVAVKGGEVVAEVVGTMASINDSSKRIAEIIGVIDGIAFQTNILALNAAVEAARAGEQGRGFAVVASEVRSLAQRSAAAAKEIKALIDDSVEKVTAGTQLADKAGNTMNEVVTSVKRVTDIIGEIADASAEQTAGIEQVNQAISAMDQATQQNAALVEESAAAAATMREQAGGLSRVVGAFVLSSEQAAKPGAQVHLISSHPAKAKAPAAAKSARPSAAAASRSAAPASHPIPRKAPPAAATTGARRATAKPDVDWEEF